MDGEYRETPFEALKTQASQEGSPRPGIWTYEEFKSCLLEERLAQYEVRPYTIHLGRDWHEALTDAVERTERNGLEWGYTIKRAIPQGENRFRLYLFGPFSGTDKDISTPGFDPKKHVQFSRWEEIGMIHTHPDQGPLWTGDLVPFLASPDRKVSLVATKYRNFLVVKAADSHSLAYLGEELLQKAREELAERRARSPRRDWDSVQRFIKYPAWTYRWESVLRGTEDACRQFRLGFYSGKPGNPLTRLA